jgi:hypothetical protein
MISQMDSNWHKKHFVSMARISHWRAMNRKRSGNNYGAMQANEESKYFMSIARSY